MTEPVPSTAPAPTEPPLVPQAPPRIGYPRSMLVVGGLYGATLALGALGGTAGLLLGAAAGVAFLVWAQSLGVLRAQTLVMAEVTGLVAAIVLELAFLDRIPSTPLPVLTGVLLVQ